MIEEILPQEGDSQEIGHFACFALEATHPTNWRITNLEGDDDVGLDKQVQLLEGNKYIGFFHIQVKGCRQTANGVNRKLSKDGTFFSEPLKISTLNYYSRIELPVMLAFADLTVDPEPRNCPVYYQWIDKEIDKLLAGHNNLDYLGKKTHTIRIPIENKINKDLDVIPYLNKRILEKKALKEIIGIVEEKYSEVEPVLSQLGSRLSTGCTLEAVLHAPEKLWSTAPEGSFAHGLNKVATYLETNRGNVASKELDSLKSRLKKASQHEKAEYYYLKTKLITLIGDYKKALNMHQKAHQLMPKEKKYHLAFVEAQANINYRKPKVCKKLIKEIDGKEGIEYKRLRAKLLALSGQAQEGIDLLYKEKEKEVIIVIALIHLLAGNYSKCRDACNKGLKRKSLSIKARLILLCMRARILFIEGMGRDFKGGEIIKFCGIAGMDIKILKKCWSDTLEAWEIASNLGYPVDVDYIVDISSVLSTYFAKTDLILYHLKELTKIRTANREAQEALFIMALNLDDKDVVKEQIKRLPSNPTKIAGEIMFYYQQGERGRALAIILDNIEKLEKAKGENYDTILLIGAECANEQLKSEELSLLLSKIKSLPNSNDIQACYRFYEAINQNPLDKKEAVNELYHAFESGCKDKQIQAQLLMHLDIHEKSDANKILKVVAETIKERHLLEREIIRVCEARITLEQWEEAISLLDSAYERFGETNVFLTLRALVLDASGDTPNALKILDKIIESGNFEPRIAEITAQIAGRCGLANKVKSLYEQLLSRESNRAKRIEIIRMLFMIEAGLNPKSPQLLRYCQEYGKLCDQTNELEEGIYLQMVFMASTLTKHKPTEDEKKTFQKRLDAFIKKFPQSNYLKAVYFDPKAKPQKFLEELSKVSGMTEKIHNWYAKNENLMQSGELVLPFAVRPNYLLNVGDLPYLWELSKFVDKDKKQYNLVMNLGRYSYRDTTFEDRIPLLDEVSLVILNDLKLLERIFIVFRKIAIAKSTLLRIQNWKQGFLCSSPKKAKEISETLSFKIDQILQPSCEFNGPTRVDFKDLDEYKRLANENGFLFYSDCVFSRLYVCGEEEKCKSITTLDIIKLLRDRGIINQNEGISLIVQLSKWNVIGVSIDYINDILASIHSDFEKMNNIQIRDAEEILEKNQDFNSLVSGMWFFDRDYFESVAQIGAFIGLMVREERGIKVDPHIIAAIWHKWYVKICLSFKGERSKLHYFARSFVSASINLCSTVQDKSKFPKYSSQLWSIYKDVVSYAFGNEMDEGIERRMLMIPAKLIAEIPESPIRNKASQFISAGITDGTKDSDVFNNAYISARLKQSQK